MALFTDGSISTLDQLAEQDSAVLDVASTEGIDASAKLMLAQEELGVELMAAFSRCSPSRTVPSIWWPGMGSTFQGVLQLSNTAITPPLRLWHTYRTLAMIYREAYSNQLNDRYLGKWNAYKDLAKWATGMLFQIGIGVVSNPLPAAQSPDILVLSGNQPAATYFVQVTWLNAMSEEGMPSAIVSVTAPDQNAIQATPKSPPVNATNWNVYAGTSIDSITMQNANPIDLGGAWITPSTGLVSGAAPGTGQEANYYYELPRYLQRG
jgi:hypothetical protein